MKRTVTILFFILFLVTYPPVSVAGAEEPAVDVVFIMDLSGSMNDSDREKVSLASVAVFADLLGESSSQIGYILFSDDVHDNVMPLTPVEQARSRIRNNLLTSKFGGWTNIPAGLDKALNLLNQSSSGNQKVAILFTDGDVQMPSGSGLSNQQAENKCREIARAYKDAGIPLYTVGLNYNGSLNVAFIKELSEISSPPGMAAKSYDTRTNWNIPEIFSKIYINLFNGNADVGLPFNSKENVQTAVFLAEEGIYELNVLLMHDSKLENLTIRQPNGQDYHNTSFQEREGYSFVKIRYPDVGDWEFSFEGAIVSANKLVRYCTGGENDTVTVAFNTNGGNPIEAIPVPRGNAIQNVPKSSKDGFSFEGWYLNEALTRPVFDGSTFSTDTLLYAKWVPQIMRNITLQGDGDTEVNLKLPDGERFYDHLSKYTVRKGYTFVAWHLDGETLLDENDLISRDAILTAQWQKIDLNLFLPILFFVFSTAIFIVGMWVSKRFFRDSNNNSAYFCILLSVAFNLTFSLFCWTLLNEYIIPIELQSIVPTRGTVGNLDFLSCIQGFALWGGLIAPFVSNLFLAAILPISFVSPASTFGKDKQYLVHLLITLLGLVVPAIIWIVYGASITMLWLLLLSFAAYTINFFLAAFLYKQGNNRKCSDFFFV